MKKQLFFALGAAAFLASCSSDVDAPKENIFDGYLHVNGTINEIKTRATDTNFTDGDRIGVSGGDYDNVLYTFNSNVFTSTDGIKVTETGTAFTAYYPYDSNLDGDEIDFTVVDATSSKPVDGVDFLFAESQTASASSPSVTFQFSHKMSQMSMTIVDKTTDEELTGKTATITLSNVATSGSFNVTDGVVTPETATGKVILENVNPATAVTAILPSYTSANQTAVKVVVAINDKTYTGYVTPAFAAGTRYSYTLNINDSGEAETEAELSIGSAEISGWTPEANEDIAMAEDYVLQVGDFLLKNGKTVAPTAANAAANTGNIVGVVYYVGEASPSKLYSSSCNETQDILYQEFYKNDSKENHGLAIAIENANDGQAARIGSNGYNYVTKDTGWFYTSENKDKYISTNFGITSASTEMLGYNNTAVYRQATTELGESITYMQDLISILDTFNSNANTSNTSKWYLPSYAELSLIAQNYTLISQSIATAQGTLNQFTTFPETTNENFYWTSDTRNTTNNWASSLNPNEEGTLYVEMRKAANAGYFRLAVAF